MIRINLLPVREARRRADLHQQVGRLAAQLLVIGGEGSREVGHLQWRRGGVALVVTGHCAQEQCRVAGVGATLFDETGACNRDGLSCLMGAPATDFHVVVCDDTVQRARTLEEGQALAVAALLAASHTCE